MKRCFQVTLNWHGEVHQFHTQAKTPTSALSNGIARLAKQLGRQTSAVSRFFKHGDRVLVKEVKQRETTEKCTDLSC